MIWRCVELNWSSNVTLGARAINWMHCLKFGFCGGQSADEERYDLVREGVVIFLGALAKHLSVVSGVFSSKDFSICFRCTRSKESSHSHALPDSSFTPTPPASTDPFPSQTIFDTCMRKHCWRCLLNTWYCTLDAFPLCLSIWQTDPCNCSNWAQWSLESNVCSVLRR